VVDLLWCALPLVHWVVIVVLVGDGLASGDGVDVRRRDMEVKVGIG
jgi:hypothetical protein